MQSVIKRKTALIQVTEKHARCSSAVSHKPNQPDYRVKSSHYLMYGYIEGNGMFGVKDSIEHLYQLLKQLYGLIAYFCLLVKYLHHSLLVLF